MFKQIPKTIPRPTVTATRAFSVWLPVRANRALVYSRTGDPKEVLSVTTFPELPPPAPRDVNIQIVLSPINPADINVLEGVYPSRPKPSKMNIDDSMGPQFVGGNECLAKVIAKGVEVGALSVGDWVLVTRPQSGTWATFRSASCDDVLKVPHGREGGLKEVDAATLSINPPTAYRLLKDFVDLKEGDYVLQNGANSAVGEAVIQLAAHRGIKTINFVRNRDNIEKVKAHLTSLGATHVLTYDDLDDRSLSSRIKEWTGPNHLPRLLLNCVSGPVTSSMARHLSSDSPHIVSYGAMSKQPLSLPTSYFIFKNLTSHGFWMARWYGEYKAQSKERKEMMEELATLMRDGLFKAPPHELIVISKDQTDEQATQLVRDTLTKMSQGRRGKKVLLQVEHVQDPK